MKSIILAFVFLCGCQFIQDENNREINEWKEKSKASQKEIQSNLPDGCEFHDAGTYDTPNNHSIEIVYVQCANVTTTSLLGHRGKYLHQHTDVLIEDPS